MLWALFSKIGGFLAFLILLLFANFLMKYIPWETYSTIVLFFNYNLGLFFIMMLIGIASDVLWMFDFPLNLPAPIASAFLSYYIFVFIFRFFVFIRTYIYFDFVFPFSLLYVVPLIVLLAGYVLVLMRAVKRKEPEKEEEKLEKKNDKKEVKKIEIKTKEAKKTGVKNKEVGWKDIGNEFKLALYGFGRTINRLFE